MLNVIVPSIISLIDKFVPDRDQRDKLAYEIATLAEKQAHEIYMAQIEVNKTEAASESTFKGGWRPFIGWVCGIAFAYHFVAQPLMLFLMATYGYVPSDLPRFDMESLLTVLLGMLGLGGLRTFEKFKGISQ